MGRRYYCDYCDKTFIDDVEARKKHLNSSHHNKRKQLHFHSFRDLRSVFDEESKKIPCHRFQANGFCQFETMCFYTHYSAEQLWEMQQTLIAHDQQNKQKMFETEFPSVPSAEEWISSYNKKKNKESESMNKEFWNYPSHLEAIVDLPPSMRRLSPEDVTDSNFAEWGL